MSSTSSRPVVAGADGSPGSAGALRMAAQEARLLEAPVRLVHVVPSYLMLGSVQPLSPADLADTGGAILTRAAKELATSAPDLTISTELRYGARSFELAAAAADAQVLLVGRDSRSLVGRLVQGNTCTGVAARSTCDTVSVSPGWPAARRGVILVGVKSGHHAHELLAAAFVEARRHGSRLVALHAWKLPSYYDDIIESRLVVDDWSQRARAELETLLAGFEDSYPDVDVETRVVHDYPSHALVEASKQADQLVIVRRAHGVPAALHLGATARAVLRGAHCPVRIVPPVAAFAADPAPDHGVTDRSALSPRGATQ